MSLTGFPPVSAPDALVLILGSMPGAASLRAAQYYAHPQNAFWRIMGDLVGAGPGLPYELRVRQLIACKIAVWDVVKSCIRPGSGDDKIVEGSITPNDFNGFFQRHPRVQCVYFNGSKAERVFRKYVVPTLQETATRLEFVRLPSTSPAHASRSYQQKLAEWRAAIKPKLGLGRDAR